MSAIRAGNAVGQGGAVPALRAAARALDYSRARLRFGARRRAARDVRLRVALNQRTQRSERAQAVAVSHRREHCQKRRCVRAPAGAGFATSLTTRTKPDTSRGSIRPMPTRCAPRAKSTSILDRLPVDERLAFALRYINGLELVAVAAACDVSLATVKRRLQRAERSFVAAAKRRPDSGRLYGKRGAMEDPLTSSTNARREDRRRTRSVRAGARGRARTSARRLSS